VHSALEAHVITAPDCCPVFATLKGSLPSSDSPQSDAPQSDSPHIDAPQGQPSSPLRREVQLDDMSDSDSDASDSAYSDDGSNKDIQDPANEQYPHEHNGALHDFIDHARTAPLGPTQEQKQVSVVMFDTKCKYSVN
jgi:hypothetical protein